MSPLERFSKWLQLKIYQFEVTFGVYIFHPAEKFFFYSVLFLLVGLTTLAIILYLPQHLYFIMSRAWFYVYGDASDMAGAAADATKTSLLETSLAGAVLNTASTYVAAAGETARVVAKEL